MNGQKGARARRREKKKVLWGFRQGERRLLRLMVTRGYEAGVTELAEKDRRGFSRWRQVRRNLPRDTAERKAEETTFSRAGC